jgi:hypothetical protein
MNSQLLKLSFDQGYEDTLVALGLEKQAIFALAGKAIGAAARGVGNMIFKGSQKKFTGVAAKGMDIANKPITQIGTGVAGGMADTAVTNATAR